MGIELELAVLLAIAVLGPSILARFEAETPAWRKVGLGVLGLSPHFWWCRRHGIHPLYATPRRRYYELRGGWSWPD